jgi:hypothetical protein
MGDWVKGKKRAGKKIHLPAFRLPFFVHAVAAGTANEVQPTTSHTALLNSAEAVFSLNVERDD